MLQEKDRNLSAKTNVGMYDAAEVLSLDMIAQGRCARKADGSNLPKMTWNEVIRRLTKPISTKPTQHRARYWDEKG